MRTRFNPGSLIVLDVIVKARRFAVSKLVLDTGATYVVVSWRLVSAIGINIDQNKTLQTTTASSIETVPKITIPEIVVFGKSVKNVNGIVKDLPPGLPVDGLLGLSFLRHFKLTIDFKKGLLSLQ